MNTIRLGAICCALILFSASVLVSQETNSKDQTLRNQVVTLTSDGLVSGRVVAIDGPSKTSAPLSGLDVYFVQNGSVVRSSVSDDNGNFVVDGLTPGAYSFIGSGAKGFVAYGVVVNAADPTQTDDSFMVAPVVSPRFVALKEIVARYLPKKTPVLLEEVEIKTSLDGVELIGDGANRVQVRDGKLVGTVRSLVIDAKLAATKVFLVQNDEIVHKSIAGESGSFEFDAVEPGVYDFIAAGPAGFAAIGFEAIQDTVETTVVKQETPEARQDEKTVDPAAPAQELDSLLTPANDGQVVVEQVDHASEVGGEVAVSEEFVPGAGLEACGDAIGCGAAAGATGCGCEEGYFEGGSGCGGGACCGGGGGGFGFGGLLPVALFAWLLTELDDDNNPNPPPPASPAS